MPAEKRVLVEIRSEFNLLFILVERRSCPLLSLERMTVLNAGLEDFLFGFAMAILHSFEKTDDLV